MFARTRARRNIPMVRVPRAETAGSAVATVVTGTAMTAGASEDPAAGSAVTGESAGATGPAGMTGRRGSDACSLSARKSVSPLHDRHGPPSWRLNHPFFRHGTLPFESHGHEARLSCCLTPYLKKIGAVPRLAGQPLQFPLKPEENKGPSMGNCSAPSPQQGSQSQQAEGCGSRFRNLGEDHGGVGLGVRRHLRVIEDAVAQEFRYWPGWREFPSGKACSCLFR